MPDYTSSLLKHLRKQLHQIAIELNVPKNLIIEMALNIYLTEIDKAAFAASFQNARGDRDLLNIAEEGMSDAIQQLEIGDETS